MRLAQGPTRSLGLSKQLLNASFETALPVSLDREAHFQALGTVSPEMAEGMAAFKERRSPTSGHRVAGTERRLGPATRSVRRTSRRRGTFAPVSIGPGRPDVSWLVSRRD